MEEQEEKEGNGLIANVVQMIILFWSLGVISWSYFNPNPTRQIDTTFAAGLLSAVTAQYGLNIKKIVMVRKRTVLAILQKLWIIKITKM